MGRRLKPVFGHGLPVKYSEGHRLPPVGFNSFEGYTDTPEARRRDGMKINTLSADRARSMLLYKQKNNMSYATLKGRRKNYDKDYLHKNHQQENHISRA